MSAQSLPMKRLPEKLMILLATMGLMALGPLPAKANPVGDFFKKIGRSISNAGRSTPTRRSPSKGNRESGATAGRTPDNRQSPAPSTIPTPTPVDIRPAARAAPDPKGRRDVPFGVVVPDRPGFVTSPYAPTQGFVDVRAFPSSTEVLDPFTGKIFLTP